MGGGEGGQIDSLPEKTTLKMPSLIRVKKLLNKASISSDHVSQCHVMS